LVEKLKKSSPEKARENLEKFIKDIGEPTLKEEKYMIDSAKNYLQHYEPCQYIHIIINKFLFFYQIKMSLIGYHKIFQAV